MKWAATRPPRSASEMPPKFCAGPGIGRRVGRRGLEAQIFGAAEEIAIFPVDLGHGAVDGRILRSRADRVQRAVADIHLDRQIAGGVELRRLDDLYRADGGDLAHARLGVRQRLGREQLVVFEIDIGAHDGLIEPFRSLDRERTDAGLGAGIDRERQIHRMGGMVDDGAHLDDLGQRAALIAKIFDDARLRRANAFRFGGIAGHQLDRLRGQLRLRHRGPAGVQDLHLAKHEPLPEVDADVDRDRRAIAIALGGAGEGRGVAAAQRQRGAVDRDRKPGVIEAAGPGGVDERRKIAQRAPRERIAVGRRVLAQGVERGGVLQLARTGPVLADDLEGHDIGQAVGTGLGRASDPGQRPRNRTPGTASRIRRPPPPAPTRRSSP